MKSSAVTGYTVEDDEDQQVDEETGACLMINLSRWLHHDEKQKRGGSTSQTVPQLKRA